LINALNNNYYLKHKSGSTTITKHKRLYNKDLKAIAGAADRLVYRLILAIKLVGEYIALLYFLEMYSINSSNYHSNFYYCSPHLMFWLLNNKVNSSNVKLKLFKLFSDILYRIRKH
jgi:hypothetical protein